MVEKKGIYKSIKEGLICNKYQLETSLVVSYISKHQEKVPIAWVCDLKRFQRNENAGRIIPDFALKTKARELCPCKFSSMIPEKKKERNSNFTRKMQICRS